MKKRNFAWLVPVVLLTGIFFDCKNSDEIEDIALQESAKSKPVNHGVTVEPDLITLGRGMSRQFTAAVKGESGGTLVWSVSGGVSETTIDNNGLLTVDANETAETLTVTAALSGDDRYGTAVVRVSDNGDVPEVNGLTVSPQKIMLAPGDIQPFNARLPDDGTEASGVTWNVNSADGSAFNGNTLTIAAGEKAEKLVVKAGISDGNYGTAFVMVLGNESKPAAVNNGIHLFPQTTSLKTGDSIKFEAYNDADNSKVSESINWQVFGGVSGTKISGGKLDIAADEGAKHLTVRAKTKDGSYGTAVVEISVPPAQPSYPSSMVQVPSGSFKRSDGTITVSEFRIGRYEVTQKDWLTVMGSIENLNCGKGDDYPVYKVTWYDAVRYCNKLSVMEGLEPAYTIGNGDTPPVTCDLKKNGYRLPTEAEWEYAARGGENYKYSGSNDYKEVAWFSGNSNGTTHPVGLKKQNGYGLYDMSGNVWEWCWDWFEYDYSGAGDKKDPTGPASGSYRVNRGGCWDRDEGDGVAFRRDDLPTYKSSSTVGFRIVRR
jgi:formylglycine-generating enzyme required for sulfatase activity